jgi:hypothetical protein
MHPSTSFRILPAALLACFATETTACPQDLPPQREPDTLRQEPGVYGTVRPEVGDVLLQDTLVHTDREGRAQHAFAGLAGSAGHCFAGVWRDMRDGNAGLYFGRLGLDGEPLEPERALYAQGSSARELEPAIALSPGGRGAFVWFSSSFPPQSLKLRTFDAQGGLSPGHTVLSAPGVDREGAEAESADDRRGASRQPAIALLDEWGAVAWSEAGALWIQRFDGGAALIDTPTRLSHGDRPLAGPHRICSAAEVGDGRLLCAWTTSQGVEAAWLSRETAQPTSVGAGVLVRVVAGDDGSAWALVRTTAGHRLQEVLPPGHGGTARNLDLDVPARDACDIAARAEDFVLATQAASGAVELCTLDPRASGAGEPRRVKQALLDLGGTAASDLRIVASGGRALVAWTGTVGRQTDVWCATLDDRGRPGEPRRWNRDELSSQQNHGRIASRGADRAAIVWLDGRTGRDQLLGRWISARGRFQGEEFPLARGPDGQDLAGLPVDPSVALGADGGMLVAWKQVEKRNYRLLARAFDAAGEPRSEILELDAGQDDPPLFKADVELCAFGPGYAAAFGRKDRGAFVRTLRPGADPGALLLGDVVQVFEHPLCQRFALTELDGGSLAVAWDITVPQGGNHAVRARVLGPRLEPRSAVIEPPLTIFGDDWDPVVAAAPGGGFGLAFCGGMQHSRDVFLRFFDAAGAVASPLVPISSRLNEQDWAAITRLTDGSLCVAFEDDLSAYDHVYVRRVSPAAEIGGVPAVGAIRTLNQREAVLNENRVIPRIAPLAGGGFAAVWVDARRGQGTDVRVKIVGPRFD